MNNEDTSLFDRVAVGFGCAAVSFITASIIWLILHWSLVTIIDKALIPFAFVWLFAILGFAIGAISLENKLLKFLSPIWNSIFNIIKNIY